MNKLKTTFVFICFHIYQGKQGLARECCAGSQECRWSRICCGILYCTMMSLWGYEVEVIGVNVNQKTFKNLIILYELSKTS